MCYSLGVSLFMWVLCILYILYIACILLLWDFMCFYICRSTCHISQKFWTILLAYCHTHHQWGRHLSNCWSFCVVTYQHSV